MDWNVTIRFKFEYTIFKPNIKLNGSLKFLPKLNIGTDFEVWFSQTRWITMYLLNVSREAIIKQC